jgi:hypothetical protein
MVFVCTALIEKGSDPHPPRLTHGVAKAFTSPSSNLPCSTTHSTSSAHPLTAASCRIEQGLSPSVFGRNLQCKPVGGVNFREEFH